jgi:hypothetical protein
MRVVPFIVTFPPDVAALKNCVPEPSKINMLPVVSAEMVNPNTPEEPENSILPDAGVILTPFAIIIFSYIQQQVYQHLYVQQILYSRN